MSNASLRSPDPPVLRLERLYSASVAAALCDAYALISVRPRTTMSYMRAYQRIAPHRSHAMSPEQRLRVEYLLALIFASLGETGPSLEHADDALERATLLRDHSAIPELLYLRSAIHRRLLDFAECAYDLRLALLFLRDSEMASGVLDADLKASVLTSLAGMEFLLGRYAACEDLLDQTSDLYTQDSNPGALSAATVAWIRSLLLRWHGEPERAFTQALAAADIYDNEESSLSSGRIHGIVADIALDLAERFTESGRESFLVLAQQHMTHAFHKADCTLDQTGRALALLTEARLSRLSDRATDRTSNIEAVIRLAAQTGDTPLSGQAYTALGYELASCGAHEAAINCFRSATFILRDADCIALAVQPQRALLQVSEDGYTDRVV